MLKRETFVSALENIKQHEALMDRLNDICSQFGDFAPNLDFNSLHLDALRAVLKDAMGDEYDYIGWWLYETADYTVWWEEDGREVECDLTDPNSLYDYLCGNPTVRERTTP